MTYRNIVAAAALIAAVPLQALAWGSTGHTMINRVAAETLPASVPAFVRTRQAIGEIATLGPEEDRIKGSGESWDADNDPGHFLDIGDDGLIAGVVRLDALPESMEAFAAELEKAGTSPYRVGFVPYEIIDGFERARKDFAYWRAADYLATHASTAVARNAFAQQRVLRETLTLRDIGDFGHFVGDGSQPLHITIHYNGWGNYPNPNGYTTKPIHSFFESEFVDRYAKIDAVRKDVPAFATASPGDLLTQAQIATLVGTYLSATATQVVPLYKLYNAGAFDRGSSDAVAFTDSQLARGATMLRNLITIAWNDSLNESIGYPPIPVKEILTGKLTPSTLSF